MANICSTDIRLYGPAEQLDVIEKVLKDSKKKGKYGEFQLSTMMRVAGLPEDVIRVAETRGIVSSFERDSDCIAIYDEDAWEPCLEPIRLVLDFLQCTDVSLLYKAVEPGCGLYLSNDDEYVGRYLFDCTSPEDLPEEFHGMDYEFMDRNEIEEKLQDWAGRGLPLEELIMMFEEEYDGVHINEFEYEPAA